MATKEQIVAIVPIQQVVIFVAVKGVISLAAKELVAAKAPLQEVVAIVAIEDVVVAAPLEGIVTG